MPELPEVKTIVDNLKKYAIGEILLSTVILSGRYDTHGAPEGFDDFCKLLPTKIVDVNQKGKFIYFAFDNGWYLHNTLGMTGGWSPSSNTHERVCFELTNSKDLIFYDIRNYGTLKFNQDIDSKLSTLGIDVLSSDFTFEQFQQIVASKKDGQLDDVLMNQSYISGVGNYLKAEILYAAKLSPTRCIKSLTDDELKSLHAAIVSIVQQSYSLGGTTIHNFSNFQGQTGMFYQHLKVYDKKKDPLGNAVEKFTSINGRTTHWVPAIQK